MSVKITDHALLRFLDRAGGVPVEELRRNLEISLAKAASAARSIGAKDYLITSDGHTFVVRHNDGQDVAVTLIERGSPAHAARLLDRARAMNPDTGGD